MLIRKKIKMRYLLPEKNDDILSFFTFLLSLLIIGKIKFGEAQTFAMLLLALNLCLL